MRSYLASLNRHSAALCVMLCGCVGAGWAADSALPSSVSQPSSAALPAGEQTFDFEIPAMPLGDALKRYGSLTQQPALFRSEVLSGLNSSAVRGRFTAQVALSLLLDGTGLVAERVRTGAGTALALKQKANSLSNAPRPADLGNLSGYPSLLQARVWETLCESPRTRPGTYRALLRLQVDSAGRIQQARLLGTSGNASRDAAMLESLQQVQLDHVPPPNMPQPLTLLILPTDSIGGTRCQNAIGDRVS